MAIIKSHTMPDASTCNLYLCIKDVSYKSDIYRVSVAIYYSKDDYEDGKIPLYRLDEVLRLSVPEGAEELPDSMAAWFADEDSFEHYKFEMEKYLIDQIEWYEGATQE